MTVGSCCIEGGNEATIEVPKCLAASSTVGVIGVLCFFSSSGGSTGAVFFVSMLMAGLSDGLAEFFVVLSLTRSFSSCSSLSFFFNSASRSISRWNVSRRLPRGRVGGAEGIIAAGCTLFGPSNRTLTGQNRFALQVHSELASVPAMRNVHWVELRPTEDVLEGSIA